MGEVAGRTILYGEAALLAARYIVQSAIAEAAGALLVTLAIWAPFLLLEVVAHEMGHVLAGRLVGFRFVFCTIGPLKITSTGRGFMLGYHENWLTMAGSAASVPTHTRNARQREFVRIAGGPLASLLLGGTAIALALATSGMAQRLCELAAITSLFSFGANMLPFKSGSSLSDGARIRMLLRSRQPADRCCAIAALVGASKHGQRPRDWDREWVARATEVPDGSLDDIAGHHLAYYSSVDRKDLAGAGRHLERALAASEGGHVPARVRWVIQLDAAFFQAYFLGDPAMARRLLRAAGAGKARHDHFMQLRAESAVLLAEGKHPEAQAMAKESLAAMDQERLGGTGWQLEREWLQELVQANS
jgi:Zn-dependent protease